MSRQFMLIALFVLIALCTSLNAEERVTFHNFKVYSINVTSDAQLSALRKLENDHVVGLEFWRSAHAIGQRADIMVAPDQELAFVQRMNFLELSFSLMVDDVQRLIDSEKPLTRADQFGWTNYYDLDTIYAWLDEQLLAYPTILTNLTVGLSYQNRTIRAIRLAHNPNNPTIFIESNIHAREWITSATATWLLNQLLTSTDPDVQDLARNINWVIVPVFNVDGFVYTHKTNRMWRKTRQPHSHLCVGTDANRNFGHMWMVTGASQNVCSETYAGPRAWSEPETKVLADFIASMSSSIKVFLSFHSYGQYFMFPYGYTTKRAPNYDALMAVAEKTRLALASKYGTEYRVGPSSTTIYETSGNSVDWVYEVQNVKLVYTIEFRDKGSYGFVLPADQIIPNGQETLDGLIAMVKEGRIQNHL